MEIWVYNIVNYFPKTIKEWMKFCIFGCKYTVVFMCASSLQSLLPFCFLGIFKKESIRHTNSMGGQNYRIVRICDNVMECVMYSFASRIVMRFVRTRISLNNESITFHPHFIYGGWDVISTPFMAFSVTHTICKGPKLGAWRSQNVTPTNGHYESIHQHKLTSLCDKYIMTLRSTHWDILDDNIAFWYARGKSLFSILIASVTWFTFYYARGRYSWAYL